MYGIPEEEEETTPDEGEPDTAPVLAIPDIDTLQKYGKISMRQLDLMTPPMQCACCMLIYHVLVRNNYGARMIKFEEQYTTFNFTCFFIH